MCIFEPLKTKIILRHGKKGEKIAAPKKLKTKFKTLAITQLT